MVKIIKASKLDVLEFIMTKGMIQPYELCESFNYIPGYVSERLRRAKKKIWW